MRRRFHADRWSGATAELLGENAYHLARVLRAKPGQEYEIANDGRVYLGRIRDVAPERVVFDIIEELASALSDVLVEVWPAVIKFARFEWLIEKATELGASAIQPLVTRRTDIHLAKAAVARRERWRKLVREAAQQSRRAQVPDVREPLALAKAVTSDTGDSLRLYLAEMRNTPSLHSVLVSSPALTSAVMLVGPEGGWTDDETQLLTSHNFTGVSLGNLILRTETAAIAALASIRYELSSRMQSR